MTFVLGWTDEDGVFLCADSAATHQRPPRMELSSFGERQQLDRATVEERAVKILQLAPRVLVAVCGDAMAGLNFALTVRTQLQHTGNPLRTILPQLGTVEDFGDGFTLLFAHDLDGRPTLTAFHSEDRAVEHVGERYATFGSMPGPKKTLAARLAAAARQHGLPPDARLAAVLVALQALGITEYLPEHGVGGAFFGAHLSANGVTWQQDLNYVTYRPGLFRSSPFIKPGDTTPIPETDAVEKIRVLIRDGCGIILSSLAGLPGRVLVPPTSERTEEEWQQIVLDAIPPPFRVLVPSKHVGLLSVVFAKAVYVFNPDLRDDGAFAVTEVGGKTHMGVVPQLMESLERQPPQGAFDFTIVTEQDGSAKTYRIAIPTDDA